jgi:UDP-N-acetylmuramate-alanine ligase
VDVAPALDAALDAAAAAARPGDVIVTLGAGSISGGVEGLLARLAAAAGGRA